MKNIFTVQTDRVFLQINKNSVVNIRIQNEDDREYIEDSSLKISRYLLDKLAPKTIHKYYLSIEVKSYIDESDAYRSKETYETESTTYEEIKKEYQEIVRQIASQQNGTLDLVEKYFNDERTLALALVSSNEYEKNIAQTVLRIKKGMTDDDRRSD